VLESGKKRLIDSAQKKGSKERDRERKGGQALALASAGRGGNKLLSKWKVWLVRGGGGGG